MRKWEPVKNHPNIYSYPTAKGKRFAVRRGFTNVLGKKDEFTKDFDKINQFVLTNNICKY